MDRKRLHLNTEQSFCMDMTPTAVPLVQADTLSGFLMCSKLSPATFKHLWDYRQRKREHFKLTPQGSWTDLLDTHIKIILF